MQQSDMLSKYTRLFDKAGSMSPRNIPKTNIVLQQACNSPFGFNAKHNSLMIMFSDMDN